MDRETLVIQLLIRFICAFAIMAMAFFSTAGTVFWPEAWLYTVLQMTASGMMAGWLVRHDLELLQTRMTLFRPAAKGWDRVFMAVVILLFIPYLLMPGFDAVRYQWSSVPLLVELAGFAGLSGSLWLIFRVLQENSFASPAVEVQAERGHGVVDTGPYAFVRHPMYSGFIAFVFCLPLALGSLWTLPLALLLAGCFVIRIFFEEGVLCSGLEGYTDYVERVRYRLLPGIW